MPPSIHGPSGPSAPTAPAPVDGGRSSGSGEAPASGKDGSSHGGDGGVGISPEFMATIQTAQASAQAALNMVMKAFAQGGEEKRAQQQALDSQKQSRDNKDKTKDAVNKSQDLSGQRIQSEKSGERTLDKLFQLAEKAGFDRQQLQAFLPKKPTTGTQGSGQTVLAKNSNLPTQSFSTPRSFSTPQRANFTKAQIPTSGLVGKSALVKPAVPSAKSGSTVLAGRAAQFTADHPGLLAKKTLGTGQPKSDVSSKPEKSEAFSPLNKNENLAALTEDISSDAPSQDAIAFVEDDSMAGLVEGAIESVDQSDADGGRNGGGYEEEYNPENNDEEIDVKATLQEMGIEYSSSSVIAGINPDNIEQVIGHVEDLSEQKRPDLIAGTRQRKTADVNPTVVAEPSPSSVQGELSTSEAIGQFAQAIVANFNQSLEDLVSSISAHGKNAKQFNPVDGPRTNFSQTYAANEEIRNTQVKPKADGMQRIAEGRDRQSQVIDQNAVAEALKTEPTTIKNAEDYVRDVDRPINYYDRDLA